TLLQVVQEERYPGALGMTVKPTIIVPYNYAARPQQFESLFRVGLHAVITMVSVDENEINTAEEGGVVKGQRISVELTNSRTGLRVAVCGANCCRRLKVEGQNLGLWGINRHH